MLSGRYWRDCLLRRKNGLRRERRALGGRGAGVMPVAWRRWFYGACLQLPMPLLLCGCLRCGGESGRSFKRLLTGVFGRAGRNGYVICDCMNPDHMCSIGIPETYCTYLAPSCHAASCCFHCRPPARRSPHLPRAPVASLNPDGQVYRPIYAPGLFIYTRKSRARFSPVSWRSV